MYPDSIVAHSAFGAFLFHDCDNILSLLWFNVSAIVGNWSAYIASKLTIGLAINLMQQVYKKGTSVYKISTAKALI